jgi:hypothetical protein
MTKGHSDPTPVTTHRGYDIRYNINADRWSCGDLDLEAEKLSTLKDKINKAIRDVSLAGLSVIDLGYRGQGSETMLTRAWQRLEQVRDPNRPGSYTYAPVWKVNVYGEDGGKKRLHANRPLEEYAPNNATTHQMLAEHARLIEAARIAREKADNYLASIPRLTLSDLEHIVPEPLPEPTKK